MDFLRSYMHTIYTGKSTPTICLLIIDPKVPGTSLCCRAIHHLEVGVL